MRISDWSSDVCSSDLSLCLRAWQCVHRPRSTFPLQKARVSSIRRRPPEPDLPRTNKPRVRLAPPLPALTRTTCLRWCQGKKPASPLATPTSARRCDCLRQLGSRSPESTEEHTSEIQFLMRNTY